MLCLLKCLWSIILMLAITEPCYGWHKSSFFVNSKLPQQCGYTRRYNPDYNFDAWGTWPWMGLLIYNGTGNHRCNSILIHPQVAISSVFCFRHVPEVAFKDHTFIAFSLPGLTSFQNISVTDIDFQGANYNSPDLALLKLEKPVIISSQVQPICLWEEHYDWDSQIGGHIGMMIGSDLDNIYKINELRVYQAPVKIVPFSKCKLKNGEKLETGYGICFSNLRKPIECHSVSSTLMLPRLAEDGSIVWYMKGLLTYRTWFCDEVSRYETVVDIGSSRKWIESHFKSSVEAGCGRRVVSHTPLITEGKDTERGDWPWHAAIFARSSPRQQPAYICGGSLISPSIILTAAHCAVARGGTRPADTFLIFLGKHTLDADEPGSLMANVADVIVHENFNMTYLYNDIALLKLSKNVIYNEYIQPACLWDESYTDKRSVVNRVGTVVGWGFTSESTLSNTLKSANIPIVEDLVCYESNANFYNRFLHDNTFCAGNPSGNRTNVCNGDSGGSLVLPILQPDQEVTWFIRGIVSVAVSKTGLRVCDPDQYAVYTDVAQYKQWIARFVS